MRNNREYENVDAAFRLAASLAEQTKLGAVGRGMVSLRRAFTVRKVLMEMPLCYSVC